MLLEEKKARQSFVRRYMDSDIYNQEFVHHMGVENELWLIDQMRERRDGTVVYVPKVHEILPLLQANDLYGPHCQKEFSDAQLELTTKPFAKIDDVVWDMEHIMLFARRVVERYNLDIIAKEFVDDPNMTLDVSPIEPRYVDYAKNNPHKVDVMCRVAAMHIHIGVSCFVEACEMYNHLVAQVPRMIDEGVWIDLRRKEVFDKVIFPGWLDMPKYHSGDDVYEHAKEAGFLYNTAENYSAVRVSPRHGTVELRLPGAIGDLNIMHSRLRYISNLLGL